MIQTGVFRPAESREIAHHLFVFSLPIPRDAEQTIYLRFENGAAMTLPLTIWSLHAFNEKSQMGHFGLGLFYGILLVMLGYNLFVFLSLRNKSYVYFVLYLAMAIPAIAYYDGLAPFYLRFDQIAVMRFSYLLPYGLGAVCFLKFTQSFLQTKSQASQLHRLLNVLLMTWGLLTMLALFAPFSFVIMPITAFWVLTLLSSCVVGYVLWRKGYRPARYFALSCLGLLVGFSVNALIRFDFIPPLPFAEQSFRAGMIWQVVLLSLALADKINQLKANTEKANRKLLESENRLAQYLEAMPVGVAVFDTNAHVQYLNKRVLEMFSPSNQVEPPSTTLEEGLARFPVYVAGTEQEYPLESLPLTKALQGERATADNIEVSLEGKRLPLEVWANPIYDEQGKIQSAISVFQDITERKRVLEEIESSRERLRALTGYLHEVTERERRALAGDVHDELGGALTSLKINLTLLERRINQAQSLEEITPLLRETQSMKSLIDKTISNMRELVRKLRPEVLDNLGLLAALQWQLQEWQKRSGVNCTFASDLERLEVDETCAIAVFRIFQETLTNIARHAQAGTVRARLTKNGEAAALEIADDGIGIPAEKLEYSNTFGILGMRERAALFGGSVKITSAPSKGTTVTISIPIFSQLSKKAT